MAQTASRNNILTISKIVMARPVGLELPWSPISKTLSQVESWIELGKFLKSRDRVNFWLTWTWFLRLKSDSNRVKNIFHSIFLDVLGSSTQRKIKYKHNRPDFWAKNWGSSEKLINVNDLICMKSSFFKIEDFDPKISHPRLALKGELLFSLDLFLFCHKATICIDAWLQQCQVDREQRIEKEHWFYFCTTCTQRKRREEEGKKDRCWLNKLYRKDRKIEKPDFQRECHRFWSRKIWLFCLLWESNSVGEHYASTTATLISSLLSNLGYIFPLQK